MKRAQRLRRFVRNNAGLLMLVLLFFSFRTAVADWNRVVSGSMEPTLYAGDWMVVNKIGYGPSIPFTGIKLLSWGEPERGDIIAFYPPHTDDLFVKRVIGVPGDVVSVLGAEVYVNGEQLSLTGLHTAGGARVGRESIGGDTHLVRFSGARAAPGGRGVFVVPESKYFVLGDNRNDSADSRFWGYVDEDRIIGSVTHVAVSLASQRPLDSRIAIAVD